MASKVMVSFPDEFLAQVDRVVQEEQRSRSELIREALRFYMGRREAQGQPGANPRVRQAIRVQDRIVHRLRRGDNHHGAHDAQARVGYVC